MNKTIFTAVLVLFTVIGTKAQNANASGKENKPQCSYFCEVSDQGEVMRLTEYRYTPNGKIVSIPIIRNGGGGNNPKELLVTGGLQPNTTYDRTVFNCQGPPSDCYRAGWSGTDDL